MSASGGVSRLRDGLSSRLPLSPVAEGDLAQQEVLFELVPFFPGRWSQLPEWAQGAAALDEVLVCGDHLVGERQAFEASLRQINALRAGRPTAIRLVTAENNFLTDPAFDPAVGRTRVGSSSSNLPWRCLERRRRFIPGAWISGRC